MDRHKLLIGEMLRLSSRNFRVKPVRAALTILGMSVGFGVVLFLVSLGYGLQYILIGNLVTTQDSLVTMEAAYSNETNLTFSTKAVADLRSLPNVAEVVPIADVPSGEVSQSGVGRPAVVDIQIIEPAYFRLSGTAPTLGTVYSTSSPGVVLTSQALALMGLPTTTASFAYTVNLVVNYEDALRATTTQTKSVSDLPIVGIISDDTKAAEALIPPDAVALQPTFYQSVLVKANSVDSVEKVRNELTDRGLIVSARVDLVNQARQITNIITIVLGVFGITALFVSAIGMFNTMIVAFMERTYEVGVLKSLGASDADVRNLFLLEAAMMGFLGGAGGVAIGFLTGQGINLALNIFATHMGGKAFTLFITPLWFVGLTIVLAIIIGVISGAWPAYRASQLSAKEAFLQR